MQRQQLLSKINILTVHQEWPALMEYVDTLIDHDTELLLGCTSWEQAKETQGRIKAYKAIRALKDTIHAAKREQS